MNKTVNGNGNGNGQSALLRQLSKKTTKPQTIAPSAVKESQVTFQTAENVELRGALMRMTRHAVVFELYNPGVTPRLSEVLDEFKIVLQGQAVYSGRAVVSKLVEAEAKVVCEATLDETQWTIPSLIRGQSEIAEQFKDFLSEWQKLYKIVPEFKVAVSDIQSFLADVRLWLNQMEINIDSSPVKVRIELEREIIQRLNPKITSGIADLTERFEHISNRIDEDLLPKHHAFCRRLLHPVTMCSPFMYRAFHKPLGYAGDYEMVNMMLRDPFEGESLFAKLLNSYALQLPPVIGHRNRISYLIERLGKETLRVMLEQRNIHIFNLGCGPAQEVQRFLIEDELANHTHFTLADFNQETLDYTGHILNNLAHRHQRNAHIKMIRRTVQQMLKEAGRLGERSPQNQYDLVYCAGLFDYLSDQVCRELMEIFYAMLLPGGLLIATNVDKHPARHQTEGFLDWHLVYRDTNKMRSLAPKKAAPENVVVKRDSSSANVFLEIRKSKSE